MGHVCPWWFAYTFDNPLRPFYHRPQTILGPYVRPGMTVADIGCGLGYFSLGLARLVGDKGRVIAVDLQPQMLERMRRRADKAGLSSIIHAHQCRGDSIEINEQLDFALAFWVVHETPDPAALFRQLHAILRPSGVLLFTEPLFHVGRKAFLDEISLALPAGFQVREQPKVIWSRAAVLIKEGNTP